MLKLEHGLYLMNTIQNLQFILVFFLNCNNFTGRNYKVSDGILSRNI